MASADGADARAGGWRLASEAELVAEARAGQPEAYGELVRRHQAPVYNVALRMAGNQQDALDLSQDAFLRAWDRLATFDADRPFGPWINRVATNLALNWLARRRLEPIPAAARRDPGTGASSVQDPPDPDRRVSPEQSALDAERARRLRRAILELPPHYRAVIDLRHFQGLSYREVASALDLPMSDVKSHLFRARRSLRAILEREP